MRGHDEPGRLCHVIFRVPDAVSDEDLDRGMRCLIGHAMDGHGFRVATALEVAETMMSAGGVEKMLQQIDELNERYGGSIEISRINPDDPFGLLSGDDDDPIMH